MHLVLFPPPCSFSMSVILHVSWYHLKRMTYIYSNPASTVNLLNVLVVDIFMIAAVTTEDKFIELKLPVRNMFFSPYLLKIMQKSSVLLLYFIINLELSPRKKKTFPQPPHRFLPYSFSLVHSLFSWVFEHW